MFDTFVQNYESVLHGIAVVATLTLELIGVAIIAVGSVRALIRMIQQRIRHRNISVIIDLGKAMVLALEFKTGAEIIKTVIVRDLSELAVLGIVILIRALLAFLIHWEIKMEHEKQQNLTKNTPPTSDQTEETA